MYKRINTKVNIHNYISEKVLNLSYSIPDEPNTDNLVTHYAKFSLILKKGHHRSSIK